MYPLTMLAVPVLVGIAFVAVMALQWFGIIKGWQNAPRGRSQVSWREVPVAGRVFAMVCAVAGLVAGVLLAMATHSGH